MMALPGMRKDQERDGKAESGKISGAKAPKKAQAKGVACMQIAHAICSCTQGKGE
jgi:hypothetical protein